MFDHNCLSSRPLIQMRNNFKGDTPDEFQTMYSSQFWYYLDNDFIDKIVAMRVYPYQNCVVLKLRQRNSYLGEWISVIVKEPELRILKRIWDCGNDGFNFAVKYYLLYSSNASQQWIMKAQHSKHCIDWYADITMGEQNG